MSKKIEEEMTKTYMIWGREIEVNVIFECYGKSNVTDTQITTYQKFEENADDFFDRAYTAIEEYIIENYSNQLIDGKIDNIFKYVVPKEIFFKQYTEDKECFGIIGYFKFDQENGIAVRFAEGKVLKVGPEQIL